MADAPHLKVQAGPNGPEELLMVVRYLLLVGDRTVRGATGQVLHSVLGTQRAEELMRSYGEELIEQGLQQGLARGRAEGRAEGVVRILAAHGVHLDDEARRRILSCSDLDTLDLWFERALRATSLSDVLEDLAR
jgi:hypothetical protein